jgi:hypothetical protein
MLSSVILKETSSILEHLTTYPHTPLQTPGKPYLIALTANHKTTFFQHLQIHLQPFNPNVGMTAYPTRRSAKLPTSKHNSSYDNAHRLTNLPQLWLRTSKGEEDLYKTPKTAGQAVIPGIKNVFLQTLFVKTSIAL